MPTSLTLDPNLLNPLSDAFAAGEAEDSFHAVEGVYQTERFVLRLSDRVHRLVDAAVEAFDAGRPVDEEMLQAYSTYLHETVHWWQHIGSSAGLIYSLQLPGMFIQAAGRLNGVLADIGPIKPLDKWSETAAAVRPRTDPTLQAVHIAINTALDMIFYKQIAFAPTRATALAESPYFMHVGHSYWMAYGSAVSVLSATADREMAYLPDGRLWDQGFAELKASGGAGFAEGVPVTLSPLGMMALMEAQARFAQLQFLCMAAEVPPSVADLRASGQFHERYGQAFDAFLTVTGHPEPEQFDDPAIALFMLIVDLAINPTRGFPLQIERYETFLDDVDPGLRFLRLCHAARDTPAVFTAIRNYSRDEYVVVADVLIRQAGLDDPMDALRTIAGWAAYPTAAGLVDEYRYFNFDRGNLVVRVLFAHFIAFSTDKLETPEFFCWPGAWKAGPRINARSVGLWRKYLSLFTDKQDDTSVYPRARPGVPEARLVQLTTDFFINVMVFDLTRQWMLQPGCFAYPFGWLTQRHMPSEVEEAARKGFIDIFRVDPEAFDILY